MRARRKATVAGVRVLTLRTLGGLSLDTADSASRLGKRPVALLALLAVAGTRGLRREKAVAFLWPESDEERGRNSLSQALTRLRRELGPDAIAASTTDLQLNPAVVWSDVQDFEAALERQELERAVTIYTGPFLDGFHVKASGGFDEWVEDHRSRLRAQQATALERLAEGADASDAVAWWRRLAALEPTSTRATLGLMRSLAARGEIATALQHYRVYEALLRDDIGAAPASAVTAYAAELRAECNRPTVPGSAPSPVVAVADGSLTSASVGADSAGAPASMMVPRRHGRVMSWWITLTSIVAVAVAMVAQFAASATRTDESTSRRVAVAPFRNLTGDSTLDALGFLAAEHIVDGLQRSGLVDVADPATTSFVTAELRDSARPNDDAKEIALVADAARAGLVISGSLARERDSIVIVTRVTDRKRGAVIGVSEPIRVAPSAPTVKLDSVRQRVLGMLAVAIDPALADIRPVGSSSPPTLAAYSEYLEGLAQFQRRREATSLPFFERAYALDSTFVAPLVWQAFAAGTRDGGARRLAAIHELSGHRERLGPIDRQALAYFEAWERHDIQGMSRALAQASALAPGSLWTYNIGNMMNGLGRSEEAVAAFDQIDRQHGWLRRWPVFWRQYARALHYVDHQRELSIVREARVVLSADGGGDVAWPVGLLLDEGRALASLGRRAELDRLLAELESSRDPTRGVGNALSQIGAELWSRGDTVYARRFFERSLDWFRLTSTHGGSRSQDRNDYAQALYMAGHWKEASSIFEELQMQQRGDWSVSAFAALCAARLGNRVRALELLARIDSMPETDWEPNIVVASRPVFLARIAAVVGDRDRAVGYIKQVNDRTGGRLSRHAQHRDFENLVGYTLYNRVTQAAP